MIVGAGAAGLSAGLVLARAQAKVLVIDAGEPRNASAPHMHGFLTRDGMPPTAFLAAGRGEVTAYGGAIERGTVTAVHRRDDDRFKVILGSGEMRFVKALLVATGLHDEIPNIPGLLERWGSLVHHCPYCHGYEVRGQSIAVLGGIDKETSLKQAGLLRRYSERVNFVTNGIQLTSIERRHIEAFGVRVIEGQVAALSGTHNAIDGITLASGSTVGCEAVFVAPRPRPNDTLLRSLACAIDARSALITVDAAGQTSVPGVWAAGNVVTPTAQVITAAGAGSSSAMAINGWLLQHDMLAASASAR